MKKNTENHKGAYYEARKGEVRKVVLLYTGTYESSVMLRWIQQEYKAEVIALTLDVGQHGFNPDQVKQNALKSGAVQALIIDARDEFASDYIAKAIQANASYQGGNYLSGALSRPLLAKWAVAIAAQEGADCIAHGCHPTGNDQIAIEGVVLALNPDISVLAVSREWGMDEEAVHAYARRHEIHSHKAIDIPYRTDDNLWGSIYAGEPIDDPAAAISPIEFIPKDLLPDSASDDDEVLEIEFVKGIPRGINGDKMRLADLIATLNKIGAGFGIGVTRQLEDHVVGVMVSKIYHAPAAALLVSAHRVLERYLCTKLENECKVQIDSKWAYTCYEGLWYEPLMDDLNAFITTVNAKVTGTVSVKLSKRSVDVVAVDTPRTIFQEKQATFHDPNALNQDAVPGFIELFTLQMRLAQQYEKNVLLSIGRREDKQKLIKDIRALSQMGSRLYATYKTHKYCKTHGIDTILVHKISTPNQKPNLMNLLEAHRFDLIINTPSGKKKQEKEQTDGQVIRQMAVRHGIPLITDIDVVTETVKKLQHSHE